MKRKRRFLETEKEVAALMIQLYCRAQHRQKEGHVFCSECQALFEYAQERIARCPYKEEKPVCERCPLHCYTPEMREKIRTVMRYAGPRMFWRHPLMAMHHLWRLQKAELRAFYK